MALFQYIALDQKGRKTRGTIDAASLQEAKQKLARKQILAVSVAPIDRRKKKPKLQKKEILNVTREWARLLHAGLPLYETLLALEEKYRGHKMHERLLDFCDNIRAGNSLSNALQTHEDCFDILYRSMIANAEKSGRLAGALDDLARLIEQQLRIKKQLLSAFMYPMLLGSFCLLVLSVLLFFVIPSLFELFEGRSLHPFTSFVFACSRGAIRAKWFLAIGLVSLVVGALWFSLMRPGRERCRKILLRLPWICDVFVKASLARFFRASAVLIEGGLSAIFALEQAESALRHPPLQASIQLALRKLTEGASLHASLQGQPLIPPLVPRIIAIAEEGGNLPIMMQQIAAIYEEDLEQILSEIATYAQPILLIVLGAMVGFVLLSVLLPLTDVSSFM